MKFSLFKPVLILGLILSCIQVTYADGNHELILDHSTITIPLESENLEPSVSRCNVSISNEEVVKLKNITSGYINDQSLLERHAKSCFQKHQNKSWQPYSKDKTKWKVNFKFGFSRTNYRNANLKIKGPELNGTIHDFEFVERTSGHFYNPANWEQGIDAFRWIDEPTNHFILTVEKGRHNIIFSMFHPKWIVNNEVNQNVRVTGNVNGLEIDKYMNLDEPFQPDYSNYTTQPGELHLVRFENTHLQMEFSLGYGYDFTLFSTKKLGEVKIQPAVYTGIMTGINFVVTRDHDDYWSFQSYKTKNQIQGPMVAIGTHIEWDLGLFDIFYQFKYTSAWMNETNGAFGGSIQYHHQYTTNTFGIGVDLFDQQKIQEKKKNFHKRKYTRGKLKLRFR